MKYSFVFIPGWVQRSLTGGMKFLALVGMLLGMTLVSSAQETTGGLQGVVKDVTGAVISQAVVQVETPTLPGGKSTISDSKGFYHFTNLPPGSYTVTVTAKGFTVKKQEGLVLEVGHLPTVDIVMSVGSENTVVEVAATLPVIDVTTVTTLTNITNDVINYVPRGTSYQSVIQFAPSARNEPLMGNTMLSNGSGGTSPGNGSNGGQFGYSVAGGSDAENSYLVEGQETANLIGGYSHTNVPFDFIQEVQIKTSGVVAEYGGALGGVVNVVMKKGTSSYHGSLFAQFENQAMDAGPSAITTYDANSAEVYQPGWKSSGSASYKGFSDASYQAYQPKKSHASDLLPGFTFGGPLVPFKQNLRDKVFFFVGFQPELARLERTINYSSAANAGTTADPTLGVVPFSRNTNTYYTTARIDAQATQKIHVFGSWLYQLQRQNGESMPVYNDSARGQANPYAGNDPSTYAHTLGYVAPNITLNTGADITLTSHIVSTTRFGYYFENYHDFGYPQGGVEWQFQNNTIGGTDANGNPLPASLQAAQYANSTAINANETHFNANKAIQLDQAFSFYKSGWGGTHNFKVGYQLNRLSNNILQAYNQPYFQVFAGGDASAQYSTGSSLGDTNCAPFIAKYGGCQGLYGYILLYDAGNGGKATSYNHGIFAQDSWTVGHGVTLDLGVRVEKEFLPGEAVSGGAPAHPINFGWGDKIAPRLGAAWDVFQNGKMKLFGSYGVFNDQMKLNLAISSFGGQYWNTCAYALDTSNLGSINVAYDANNRYCSGFDSSLPGHFAGATPAGLTFLENINYRAFPTTCSTCSESQEGVAPGLKPYRQHEAVAGWDYQLSRNIAFEARYDRRRLDHVIEDASIYNPQLGGETFVVVNPGQGTNASFSGFCNFLYPTSQGFTNCVSSTGATPPDKNIAAARSYDGVEFRLNKAMSQHWAGLFSYTYSSFRGNYTGLTSSDQADAGGGRNSPNNSRAFDEPYFQFDANGLSSSGPLPTDRPNTLKGYAFYQLTYLKNFSTDLGIFQTLYQGSPNSSILDAGAGGGAWLVYPAGRGGWVDVTQNQSTGVISVGNPRVYRTPWYNQTDFNVKQNYQIGEAKAVSFTATFTNLLNQHTVTSVVEQVDTGYSSNYIRPGNLNITGGVPFYAAAEKPYNVTALLNGTVAKSNNKSGPLTLNSQYGQPNTYQLPRTIRLQAAFTF